MARFKYSVSPNNSSDTSRVNIKLSDHDQDYLCRQILRNFELPRYENLYISRLPEKVEIEVGLNNPIKQEEIEVIGLFVQSWLDGWIEQYHQFEKLLNIYKELNKPQS